MYKAYYNLIANHNSYKYKFKELVNVAFFKVVPMDS